MDLLTLKAELNRRKVTLGLTRYGALSYSAPLGTMTIELYMSIKRHRSAIIDALAQKQLLPTR